MKERKNEEDMKAWKYFGATILMWATMNGRPNVLKWLIYELNFDVNEQNIHGGSALHLAISNNQMECAKLLLPLGSLRLKNQWGNTPLDCAIAAKNKEMKKLLESHLHSC